MSMEYISIVLFAGDDIACLESCIYHILDFTPSGQCELIIVEKTDNAAIHEYVCRLPNIRVIEYADGCTAGLQCILAVQAATSEKILFMQDIVLVKENWLSYMCGMLDANPLAGVVQVLTQIEPCDDEYVCRQAVQLNDVCCLIDKHVLQSVGVFLPVYKTTKYIFADLGMRLWKNNKQVITLSNSCFDVSTLDYESFFQEDYNADILSYKERNGFYLGYSTSVRNDILSVIDYRKPGIKVLEIGCACGATLLEIKTHNPSVEVYGIEICESAAAIAKNFANVLADDFEKLERDDFAEKFDYIVMGDVLEHLLNTDAALQKVRNWLKPGGHFVVCVPNVANISIVMSLLSGCWEYVESGILDKTHIRFFTKKSLQQYLQKNGFHVERWHANLVKVSPQIEKVFNAAMNEFLKLKTVDVKRETLETFQIICVAGK